jgi:hypothetical protein
MKYFNILALLITLIFSSCGSNDRPIEQASKKNQNTEALLSKRVFTGEDVENLSSLLSGESFYFASLSDSNGKNYSKGDVVENTFYFSKDNSFTIKITEDGITTPHEGEWSIHLEKGRLLIYFDGGESINLFPVYDYGADYLVLVRDLTFEDDSEGYLYLHYLIN